MYQIQASETHPTFLLGKDNEKLGKEVMEERGNSATLGQTALNKSGQGCELLEGRYHTWRFPWLLAECPAGWMMSGWMDGHIAAAYREPSQFSSPCCPSQHPLPHPGRTRQHLVLRSAVIASEFNPMKMPCWISFLSQGCWGFKKRWWRGQCFIQIGNSLMQ